MVGPFQGHRAFTGPEVRQVFDPLTASCCGRCATLRHFGRISQEAALAPGRRGSAPVRVAYWGGSPCKGISTGETPRSCWAGLLSDLGRQTPGAISAQGSIWKLAGRPGGGWHRLAPAVASPLMTDNDPARQCEVPGCPNPAAYGLRVCEQHLREPASPKDHAEALAYLRGRLARFDRHWIEPDRADGLMLHGTYDITALRLVLEGAQGGAPASLERPAGYKRTARRIQADNHPAPTLPRDAS
jgi:hypothetical protein